MAAIEGRHVVVEEVEKEEEEQIEVPEVQRKGSTASGTNPRSVSKYNVVDSLNSFRDEVDLNTWEAPEDIRRNYQFYLSGYDNQNRPIWIAEVGKWNMRKIVAGGPETMKMFARYIRQGTYRAIQSVVEKSTPENPVTDAIIIVDMTNLNVIQLIHIPTMVFVFQLAKEHKVVVTRHIYKGIVINTGYVGQTAINLVKPVIGKLGELIEVFGSDRSKWEPKILKYCPKNQIPELYGGNKDFTPVRVFI